METHSSENRKLQIFAKKWGRRVLSLMAIMASIGILFYFAYHYFNVEKKEDYTVHINKKYQPAKIEPKQGVYLGAYVLQNPAIEFSMKTFNQLTQKQHASFFKYVGYGQPFPTKWVNNVKAVGAIPHIAFEPNNGLGEVMEDEYLIQFAKDAHDSNVPIFLRYASEMNGTWTNYTGDPEAYIEKWRLVHKVMNEYAPNVAMLWSVLSVPEETVDLYYPGDAYVDWVGVNIYSVKYHNNAWYHKSDFENPIDSLDYIYTKFSSRKPIQISEFGVTHFNIRDNEKDNAFAIDKLNNMYTNLKDKYPRVKSIYYFDVNNLNEYNEARRVNDYSITTEEEITKAYTAMINNPHFLSRVEPGTDSEYTEHFTYRGKLYEKKDHLYADIDFLTDFLHLDVQIKKDTAIISRNGLQVEAKIEKRRIWTGYNYINYIKRFRNVKGIDLHSVLPKLGYTIEMRDKTHLYVHE